MSQLFRSVEYFFPVNVSPQLTHFIFIKFKVLCIEFLYLNSMFVIFTRISNSLFFNLIYDSLSLLLVFNW